MDQAELLRRRREARQEKIRSGGGDRLERITRTSRGEDGQVKEGSSTVTEHGTGQTTRPANGQGPLGRTTPSSSSSSPQTTASAVVSPVHAAPYSGRLSREEIRAYGAQGMTPDIIRAQGGFGGSPPLSERERPLPVQRAPAEPSPGPAPAAAAEDEDEDPEEVGLPEPEPRLPTFPQPRPPRPAAAVSPANPYLQLVPALHLLASVALALSLLARRQRDELSLGNGILLPPLAWSFILLQLFLEGVTWALGHGRGGPPIPKTMVDLAFHVFGRLSQISKDAAVILFIVILTNVVFT